MGSEVLVLAVAGVFLPPVVSFLKNQKWPNKLKFLVSVAAAFVVAAGVMAVQGEFHSVAEFSAKASVTWATSQVFYNLYFGDTEWNEKLEEKKVLPW